ncbi:hypothetical protein PR048_002381 [Dryococelus australis]|uniref:Uncharacterized protein n=1 Tax=Dryococelus australis TaxID=614101 RepID=A0ABQ9IK04_9NEOP|nr:hypothetical protein PR048_002381 [Dryococelus australis]
MAPCMMHKAKEKKEFLSAGCEASAVFIQDGGELSLLRACTMTCDKVDSTQVRIKAIFLMGEFSVGEISAARCAVFQREPIRVIEVSMEQRRNEMRGKREMPENASPTNGIVRHDFHIVQGLRRVAVQMALGSVRCGCGARRPPLGVHHAAAPYQRTLRAHVTCITRTLNLHSPLGPTPRLHLFHFMTDVNHGSTGHVSVWKTWPSVARLAKDYYLVPHNYRSNRTAVCRCDKVDLHTCDIPAVVRITSTFRCAEPECKGGETGDPRENPPISGIVRHDSSMRKSGSSPAGNRTRVHERLKIMPSGIAEVTSLTAPPPLPLASAHCPSWPRLSNVFGAKARWRRLISCVSIGGDLPATPLPCTLHHDSTMPVTSYHPSSVRSWMSMTSSAYLDSDQVLFARNHPAHPTQHPSEPTRLHKYETMFKHPCNSHPRLQTCSNSTMTTTLSPPIHVSTTTTTDADYSVYYSSRCLLQLQMPIMITTAPDASYSSRRPSRLLQLQASTTAPGIYYFI